MAWYDEEYDVGRETRKMIPPVGVRTAFRPGAEGMLEKDLGAPQREREALPVKSTLTPGVPEAGNFSWENVGGKDYYIPGGGVSSAIAGVEAPSPPGVGTNIPSEWKMRFDEAIAGLTTPSPELTTLRNQAQGYSLPMGKAGRQTQIEAVKALSQVEGHRKTALNQLADTMANLMMKPQEFAKDIWGKQLEYNLGQRKTGIAERGVALEEALLPERIAALREKAPETTTGYGPGGERILYGWNPQKRTWDVMTQGALPVEVAQGSSLVNPATGELIHEGKGSKFQDQLGQLAYKGYLDELKGIEKQYEGLVDEKSLTEKAFLQQRAYQNMINSMRETGHENVFQSNALPIPREGNVWEGKFGRYIYRNGQWEPYKG
jgi:hypothetical protein